LAREQREVQRNLREGLERIKLASQQDTGSPCPPTACSRACTGRKSNALLAAVKSLAADITAIKLAVVGNGEAPHVSQRQAPARLTRAASAAAAVQQQLWSSTPESNLAMAPLWPRPKVIAPLLQQGFRPSTHAPSAPASLTHLHDMPRPAEPTTPTAAQPARRVSRSRPAPTTFSTPEAPDPADAAWRNEALATAPPLPPEWGFPADGGTGAAHSSSQAKEWGDVVLVPGRGRLPPFFSRGVQQVDGVSSQTRPRQRGTGHSVSWAVALEAALDSDRDGMALEASR
jgi:hypothetical protein